MKIHNIIDKYIPHIACIIFTLCLILFVYILYLDCNDDKEFNVVEKLWISIFLMLILGCVIGAGVIAYRFSKKRIT